MAYAVVGLPAGARAIIAERPGGWRVVMEDIGQPTWNTCYPTPGDALEALKTYLESLPETQSSQE
jgi:hypothetical protein